MIKGLRYTAARRHWTNLENVQYIIGSFLRCGSTCGRLQVGVGDCCTRERRITLCVVADSPIACIELSNVKYVGDGDSDSVIAITDNYTCSNTWQEQ